MVRETTQIANPSPPIGSKLSAKIRDRSAQVGVVGLGYVGLPTMVAISQSGFSVTGIDVSAERVNQINSGESYIEDVPSSSLKELVDDGRLRATSDYAVVANLDVILVCVPTPITKNKEPDLSLMEHSIDNIAEMLKSDQLVVLQSTTFPGTTQEIVQPRLEADGKRAGHEFHLAFALERIDPGNEQFAVRDVPKVVGGVTEECTNIGVEFFSAFVNEVMPVSSPRVAEMTKLLENTFRSVNIALVNELAMLCQRMDINIWEVIEAASTKPYGFMPFYPGPGVGGHCIPVDPFYLSWKAKEHDFYVNFIQLAAEINDNMPHYTLSRIMEILGDRGVPLRGAKLLVLGVTFKENVVDTRNSPAIRVAELLMNRGAEVSYADQNVPTLELNGTKMESVGLGPEILSQFDAAIIMVGHRYYDLAEVVAHSKLVIDTRNAAKALGHSENLVRT